METQKPSHPQQRTFATSYGWKGESCLFVIEPDTKVNAKYFIKHVLSPMMLEDVPRLYGANADKIVHHFDYARSHTAKLTYDWLNALEISHITKEEWLANLSEVSSMNFSRIGTFKIN
jgi:hypothetical protein